MEPFVRGFIRASLVWLGVGVLIGVGMAFVPGEGLVYRPAHMHANLLGFVSMMIFGVAYHVIPRFTGHPLYSRREATVHFWVANAGLAGMVGGFVLRAWSWEPGFAAVRIGSALAGIGAFLFIHNLWRTLGSPAPRPVAMGGPTPSPRPGAAAR